MKQSLFTILMIIGLTMSGACNAEDRRSVRGEENAEQRQDVGEAGVYYGTYYGDQRTVLTIHGDTATYVDLDGHRLQLTRNEKGAFEGSSFSTGHIVARKAPKGLGGGYMISRH